MLSNPVSRVITMDAFVSTLAVQSCNDWWICQAKSSGVDVGKPSAMNLAGVIRPDHLLPRRVVLNPYTPRELE